MKFNDAKKFTNKFSLLEHFVELRHTIADSDKVGRFLSDVFNGPSYALTIHTINNCKSAWVEILDKEINKLREDLGLEE